LKNGQIGYIPFKISRNNSGSKEADEEANDHDSETGHEIVLIIVGTVACLDVCVYATW
jgi:hypothetical protein